MKALLSLHVFHLANLLARLEAKRRILKRDWLTLVGEKIRREQVVSVPTFFTARASKFDKWKTCFTLCSLSHNLECTLTCEHYGRTSVWSFAKRFHSNSVQFIFEKRLLTWLETLN